MSGFLKMWLETLIVSLSYVAVLEYGLLIQDKYFVRTAHERVEVGFLKTWKKYIFTWIGTNKVLNNENYVCQLFIYAKTNI